MLPQFALLAYEPADVIPGKLQEYRADRLVSCMASVPGRVLNTRTGYVWLAAGKQMSVHEPAAADIFRAGPGPERAAMRDEFERRIAAQYYDVIMFGPQLMLELEGLLNEQYRKVGMTFDTTTGDPRSRGYMLANVYVSKSASDLVPDRDAFCEQGALQ
jgi:hypothetical protein